MIDHLLLQCVYVCEGKTWHLRSGRMARFAVLSGHANSGVLHSHAPCLGFRTNQSLSFPDVSWFCTSASESSMFCSGSTAWKPVTLARPTMLGHEHLYQGSPVHRWRIASAVDPNSQNVLKKSEVWDCIHLYIYIYICIYTYSVQTHNIT